MAEVILRNVKKVYGSLGKKGDGVVAVKDFDLTIRNGEFLSLLGPSGCGKTTILRMIVGLEAITEGVILIDGQTVNNWSPARRNVAMAFETYALYSHLSIRDNLGFCLKAKGAPAHEIQERVNRIAEILHITDILDTRPSNLSGGQQQRVSLGRALIREPSVFLLDEPLSHLDAALRLETRIEIKRIHQRIKGTFIYVTHDQMEALALADRVAVMNFAELQQAGNRRDLYERPANIFVADFVGEPPINLYRDSTIETSQSDLYAVSPGGEYRFKLSREMKRVIEARTREKVTVGIRPQHISLHARGGKETLSAKIAVLEFLGETGSLTVNSKGLDLNLLAPADLELNKGETVTVYYDPQRVLLFDSETGKNLAYEKA